MKQIHILQHKIVHEVESHYIQVEIDGHIDNDALTRLMGTYLWEDVGMEIMRCKGKYTGAEAGGKVGTYMLQGVGDLFELREVNGAQDGPDGKFLFVGRGIDAEKLREEIK